jgi:hypothetical protein
MTDLPEPDPIGADRRRARKRSKLPPDAHCELCGISDPDVLFPPAEPLLELQHVLGRAAAPQLTVVLCRNCHARQTSLQHDHDALPPLGTGTRPDSVLERLARALTSLALFLQDLAHTLTRFAAQLFALAQQLDLAVPGWRDWEAAQ